jgi:hypothetical protein
MPLNAVGEPPFVVGALPMIIQRNDPDSKASEFGQATGFTPGASAVDFRCSRSMVREIDQDCLTYMTVMPYYGTNPGSAGIKASDRSRVNSELGSIGYSRLPRSQNNMCLYSLVFNVGAFTAKGLLCFCCSYDMVIKAYRDALMPETVMFDDALDAAFNTTRKQIPYKDSWYDLRREGLLVPAGTLITLSITNLGTIGLTFMIDAIQTMTVTRTSLSMVNLLKQSMAIAHRGITGATPTHTYEEAKSKVNFYYNSEVTNTSVGLTLTKISGVGLWRTNYVLTV